MYDLLMLLSILGGAFGCLALALSPGLGVLLLVISTLVFLMASRWKREEKEQRRHEELLEMLAERDRTK